MNRTESGFTINGLVPGAPRERTGYECERCSFGTASAAPPAACPMCGGGIWRHGRNGYSVTVSLLSGSTVVITPPEDLDAPASALLAETVVELAAETPELVVDLTNVALLEESTAQLLLRLGALAHGSGGRLLAVCPTFGTDEIELHELDGPSPLPADRIGGCFGRALRALARTEASQEPL